MKFNLSFLVVFSYIICYLLAPNVKFQWTTIGLLAIAGLCITGAANAANQLIECSTDALMSRTKRRPLVQGVISKLHTVIFIFVTLIAGLLVLAIFFNYFSAILSLGSFLLYVYVYTPLKRKSSFAVFVGGIPGALPCLIGWSAATGDLSDYYCWILFLIQFFWQFPHFWSLAWIVHKDYQKAGYRLLPFGLAPGRIVAIQTLAFSLPLLIASTLPYILSAAYLHSLFVSSILNLVLIYHCVLLVINNRDMNRARRVMITCYFYLPLLFLSLLLFKTPAVVVH